MPSSLRSYSQTFLLFAFIDGLTSLFSSKQQWQNGKHRGSYEQYRQAAYYLRRKGYIVVARRWSAGEVPGDIDLIAWQGPMLCFVEVKTRTAHDASPAEIAVDSHKRNTLRRLARRYVRQLPQETAPPVRFDVLSVYLVHGEKKEFQHFESAFGWSEQENYERY